MRRELLLFSVLVVAFLVWSHGADAEVLSFRSDTISVSQPASGSNHSIKFTTLTTVPVSGKIVITPEAGDFTIPAGLDYTDVDLLVGAVQQALATTSGTGAGTAVGVSVTTGTSGSVTLTLNDTDTIVGGSVVEVLIGTNATFGTTGDVKIINPGAVGSYDMFFETQDAASATLDDRGTVIAIVERVGLSAEASPTPTPGGGRRTTPTPTPNFGNITFWPTSFQALTVQEFSDATISEVSQFLSVSPQTLSSVLISQYPALQNATGQEFAGNLGVSTEQLYNTLESQYSALSAITPAQFANATAADIASIMGVSIEELYVILGVDMQDIATILGISVLDIWNFLELAEFWDLNTTPSGQPETTIGTSVLNSSGTVQLEQGGQPYSFITEQAGDFGLTIIEDGSWEITTYAQATDLGGNTTLSVQLVVIDENGVETLMFSHVITNDLSSSPTEYITYTSQNSFVFDPEDRIVVRYFTSTSGSSGPVDVTLFYEGLDRYSHIQTPPSIIPSPCSRIADFTFECLVNLPDLSIMMYNWPVVRNRPETDLNSDGTVGIVDFSILLFWWTG